MSLDACAAIVAKGDADRFAAAMAAPVAVRRILLPIYAFNVEVARAPWVTSEPMIAEMRLQWWRDALDEIATGAAVRGHEVTTPLAEVLDKTGPEILDKLIAARRWDIQSDPFEDEAHLAEYLNATGGGLMWVAGRVLGGDDERAFRRIGRASALANLFLAIPDLEARGRKPLVDGRPDAVAELAKGALADLSTVKRPRKGHAATLAAWRAPAILAKAARDPLAVIDGRLSESEFLRRGRLLWQSLRL